MGSRLGPSRNNLRVLLVEDNVGDVELMRDALRAHDIEPEVARDGESALESLSGTFRPDLILMDLKMPRMSGHDLLAALKSDPRLAPVPVVVLTSSMAPTDVARAYALQAAACFAKPPDGFRALMDHVIGFFGAASQPDPLLAQAERAATTRPQLAPDAPPRQPLPGGVRRAALLASVVDSAGEAIIGMDLEGTITAWNGAAESLYGYTAREAVGRRATLFMPDDQITEVQDALREHLAGDVVRHLRNARADRDGHDTLIELTISPIYDSAGALVGASAIARDVTEQQRAEERFRLAVEASPSAMVMVRADGIIEMVNAETERLFGYSREQLVGSSIELLVPAGFRAHHPALRDGFTRHPEVRVMGAGRELYGLRRDGTELPVEIGLNPIATSSGLRILCSVVDITERRLADERFRLAVEASPSGIAMVDEAGQIVLVNAETERMFRYRRGELIGRSIDELVPERFRGQHRHHRGAFGQKPESRTMGTGRELYGLRRDGTEFPVEIGLNPIRVRGGLRVLSTIVDITERKRVEAELAARREELARSNEELEQFAYVASHDLQEPLRMVSSFTELLVQKLGDDLDDEAKRYVWFVQDGAARMRTLIQDLLSLSRVRTRGRDLVALRAEDCVAHAIQNVTVAVEESGASIESSVRAEILGDESQITTLFQNLFSNALKFRGEDAPRIRVTAQRDGEMWRFAVSDNGIGIAPKHAERVFSLFERLHTREEHPGTGIGLTICKRVVERHRGTIWIESDGTHGSTFLFTLPAAG